MTYTKELIEKTKEFIENNIKDEKLTKKDKTRYIRSIIDYLRVRYYEEV